MYAFYDDSSRHALYLPLLSVVWSYCPYIALAIVRLLSCVVQFLGSITKTTNSTNNTASGVKEEASDNNHDDNNNITDNPKRESSMEIKSIKLHAHSALVTKDNVDVLVNKYTF